jgi:uncharacterized membrane protein
MKFFSALSPLSAVKRACLVLPPPHEADENRRSEPNAGYSRLLEVRPYRELTFVVGGFALGYSICAVSKHLHFDSSYDLAIYDQAIWHLSRFEAPASSVRGMSNVFGDHFHPVIALLAPLVWIAPRAEMLIVAQSVLLAASIVPVFLYARDRLAHGPAIVMSIAYGLFWGMQQTATFDFHEAAFAPLAVALLILAMERKRWGWFWAAAVGVAAVKEDLAPFLAFVGAYLMLRGERVRGAILLAGGVAAFAVIVAVVIPMASDAGAYGYQAAFGEALHNPWRLPFQMVTPPIKMLTAFLWVAPFALVPLASPLSLLLLPFALERFLSGSQNHWGTIFHYSAPLAPVVAMAAVDGLARIASTVRDAHRRRQTVAILTGVCVLFASLIPGNQPLWRLFSKKLYRFGPVEWSARAALDLIPAGASVVAQTCIAPHLAHRRQLFALDRDAPDADYVVAVDQRSAWPLASGAEVRALLADRIAHGYFVLFDRDGWVVLQRNQPASIPALAGTLRGQY